MPKISEFHGVVIAVYYDDHPPPHFQAEVGGDEVLVALAPVRLLRGRLAPARLRRVLRWARCHERSLLENWTRAEQGRPLVWLSPLS